MIDDNILGRLSFITYHLSLLSLVYKVFRTITNQHKGVYNHPTYPLQNTGKNKTKKLHTNKHKKHHKNINTKNN